MIINNIKQKNLICFLRNHITGGCLNNCNLKVLNTSKWGQNVK